MLGGRGGGRGALGRLRTLDLSHNFIMAMDGDSLAGDHMIILYKAVLCTLDEKELSNLLCYLPDSNSKAYIK